MNPDPGPDDGAGQAVEYTRRLVIGAPREHVFDAIATVDGPRHWWTAMVMHVTASRRPSAVE
jgi:uncharacterized protein YndB with AHSA1/START domain